MESRPGRHFYAIGDDQIILRGTEIRGNVLLLRFWACGGTWQLSQFSTMSAVIAKP